MVLIKVYVVVSDISTVFFSLIVSKYGKDAVDTVIEKLIHSKVAAHKLMYHINVDIIGSSVF